MKINIRISNNCHDTSIIHHLKTTKPLQKSLKQSTKIQENRQKWTKTTHHHSGNISHSFAIVNSVLTVYKFM